MDEFYNHKKIKAFLVKYNKKDWKDIILQLSLIGLKQVVNQRVYSLEELHKMNQEKEGVTSLNKNKNIQNSTTNEKVVPKDNQKGKSVVKDSKKESVSKASEIKKKNSIVKDSNSKTEEVKEDISIKEDQPKQNAINTLPNEDLPIKSDVISTEKPVETINEVNKPKEEVKEEVSQPKEEEVKPDIKEQSEIKNVDNITNPIPSSYTYERRYPTDYSYCDTKYKRALEESRAFRNQLLYELNYDYTQPNIEDTINSRYSLHNTYTYQLNSY